VLVREHALTDTVTANNAQREEADLEVTDQVSRLISTRLTPADLEATFYPHVSRG